MAVLATERQFTMEFPLCLSRGAERSKHLIYYYPVTEQDILIQSVGTHNKLEITLSASLVWQLITSLNPSASVVPSGAFSAYIFAHKEQVPAYIDLSTFSILLL